jgi:hypothetical protein
VLEALEERVTPTIMWNPAFGPEQAVDHGGSRLSSAAVFLIFWGPQWEIARPASDPLGAFDGPGDEQRIIDGVRNSLNGSYQSGLTVTVHGSNSLVFQGFSALLV